MMDNVMICNDAITAIKQVLLVSQSLMERTSGWPMAHRNWHLHTTLERSSSAKSCDKRYASGLRIQSTNLSRLSFKQRLPGSLS